MDIGRIKPLFMQGLSVYMEVYGVQDDPYMGGPYIIAYKLTLLE